MRVTDLPQARRFVNQSIFPDLSEVLSFRTDLHSNPASWYFRCVLSGLLLSSMINTLKIAIHVIRIHAIYDKSRPILYAMGSLFALQIVLTGIACGFYHCTFTFAQMYSPFAHQGYVPSQRSLFAKARVASRAQNMPGWESIGSHRPCCIRFPYGLPHHFVQERKLTRVPPVWPCLEALNRIPQCQTSQPLEVDAPRWPQSLRCSSPPTASALSILISLCTGHFPC